MKVPSHIKWEITEPSRSEHNQAEPSRTKQSSSLESFFIVKKLLFCQLTTYMVQLLLGAFSLAKEYISCAITFTSCMLVKKWLRRKKSFEHKYTFHDFFTRDNFKNTIINEMFWKRSITKQKGRLFTTYRMATTTSDITRWTFLTKNIRLQKFRNHFEVYNLRTLSC